MKRLRPLIPVIVLLTIFGLGAFLRFYRLGDIPVGFHRDEAYLGYNAYSILKTGRDMTGNFLPIHIPSFLYCPGGYAYFSIPPIALFGLSPFSVRFASALFGTLTVLMTYFLTLELIAAAKAATGKATGGNPQIVGWLASLCLAVTPWHINLSRTATENTIVVFFIDLGTYLFLTYVRTRKMGMLIGAFASFAVTLAVYQAPRAFLPLFIPLLVGAFIPRMTKRQLTASAGIFAVTVLIPLVLILKSPELATRIRTVSLFATPGTQLIVDEYIREDGIIPNNATVTRIFHNKPVAYVLQGVRNYFSHWSYDFLFTDETLPMRYRIPGGSSLYLAFLPLILAGAVYLLTLPGPLPLIVLGWLALAPIGSSLTFDDVPNVQRTLIVFPALSILTAFGAVYLFGRVKLLARWIAVAAALAIAAVTVYNAAQYLHSYYIQQLVHRPWYRHEGYKDMVATVNTALADRTLGLKRAIVTNSESAPTIFFLFFGRYDPHTFQEEIRNSAFTSYDRIDFSRYSFTLEECPFREYEETDKTTGEKRIVTTGKPGILYVNYGVCKTPTVTGTIIKTVKRSDNTRVFELVTLKNEATGSAR